MTQNKRLDSVTNIKKHNLMKVFCDGVGTKIEERTNLEINGSLEYQVNHPKHQSINERDTYRYGD